MTKQLVSLRRSDMKNIMRIFDEFGVDKVSIAEYCDGIGVATVVSFDYEHNASDGCSSITEKFPTKLEIDITEYSMW